MTMKFVRLTRPVVSGLVGIALLGMAVQAHAATDTSGVTATAIATFGNTVNAIEATLQRMVSESGAGAIGIQMLGFFVLMNVVWALIKGMATGRMVDYMIGEMLPIGVVAVIAWMFLGQVGGVQGLGESTKQFMDHVGHEIAGKNYGDGSIAKLIETSARSTFRVISRLLDFKVSESTTGFWDFNASGALLTAISAFIKYLILIVVFFILVVTLGVFISTVILTQMSVYIALIVMPLFIPFMVFKPLESFFDKWLTFFVSSLMAKVIGALIVTITDTVMLSMVTLSEKLPPPKSGLDGLVIDCILYAVMVVMAFVCYMMVQRIDSIARGLTGSVALGFKGFGQELRGGMGGIGKSESPGGGFGSGKASPNVASGLTSLMPNPVKPFTRAAGNVVSTATGKRAFNNDLKAQTKAGVKPGEANFDRDLSKMSQRAADAYRSAQKSYEAKAGKQPPSSQKGGAPAKSSWSD